MLLPHDETDVRNGTVHHEAATTSPVYGPTFWTALCGAEMAGQRTNGDTTTDRCAVCSACLVANPTATVAAEAAYHEAAFAECGATPQPDLRARVDRVRTWTRARLALCRAVEARPWTSAAQQNAAWTERRALETVLRMLDGEETP